MQMAYLEDAKIDDFLMKPILACALAAMANRENDSRGRELARQYYVQAINATQAALFDPKKVREDNTLFAVSLLAIFEVRIYTLFILSAMADVNSAYNLGSQLLLRLVETARTRICSCPPAKRPSTASNKDWGVLLPRNET